MADTDRNQVILRQQPTHMTSNTIVSTERFSESNIQNLLHVYSFLLKRAHQQKLEMKTVEQPVPRPEIAPCDDENVPVTSNRNNE